MAIYKKAYVFRKQGIYYFQRRVPSDLRRHYRSDRVSVSLRTSSRSEALIRSKKIASQLESYWFELRLKETEFALPRGLVAISEATAPTISIEQVRNLYLERRGSHAGRVFEQTTARAFEYLTSKLGDRPFESYQRTDALKLRDWLLARGLAPQSAKRTLSVIQSAFQLAIDEFGLDCTNVFARLDVGRSKSVHARNPISELGLRNLQSRCRDLDDANRWLVALISDTGMRLAEALGLAIADIHLDGEVPFVEIQPHPWRRLKTAGSARKVPLVGASLWAAERLVARSDGQFAFPTYCNANGCNSNSASAALGKWMKSQLAESGVVVHSFRHSLRDRLRNVGCPSDVADQIGGWKTAGVGQTYGHGYALEVMKRWMNEIELQPND